MDWKLLGLDDEEVEILGLELANEVGRKILKSLKEFPKSPNDLSKELNIPLTTVVFHVERLTRAGLIKPIGKAPGKRGRKTLYALNAPAVVIVPTSSSEKGKFFRNLIEKTLSVKRALAKTVLISLMVGLVMALPLLFTETGQLAPVAGTKAERPVAPEAKGINKTIIVPRVNLKGALLVILASLVAGLLILLLVRPYSEQLP